MASAAGASRYRPLDYFFGPFCPLLFLYCDLMTCIAVLREVYPYFLANRAVIGKARLPVLNKHTNQVATHVCLADGSVVREAISRGIAAEEPMRVRYNCSGGHD